MAEKHRVIKADRGVIIACDVPNMDWLSHIVKQTHDLEGIVGYKTPVALAEKYGLPALVKTIREFTPKPIIHDGQKACNDIPKTQKHRVAVAKESGVDAIIGFPFTGPATQEAFIKACETYNIVPIMGGDMTIDKFTRSEGGYIADNALLEMYTFSARLGVVNFVCPGNKPGNMLYYYENLVEIVKEVSGTLPRIYSPGFSKGGAATSVESKMASALKVASPSWYPIVGEPIFDVIDIRAGAEYFVRLLRKK